MLHYCPVEWQRRGHWASAQADTHGDCRIDSQDERREFAADNCARENGARQGDTSLLRFRTRDGLIGTESATGQPDKTLDLVAGTRIQLLPGELKWHQHESHKTPQAPHELTALGGAFKACADSSPAASR